MRNLAHRVIAAEYRLGDSADTEARAAFRVCEKLRESLSVLSGARGYRTLLVRALTTSKVETTWLARFEVDAHGALVIPEAVERELSGKDAARGGAILVAQLLELLATFVGNALTQRLVQQIWPDAAFDDPPSGGKK